MSIDSRTLRQTVGQFVTGVTIIATEVEGSIHAMTANSFTSLSLDPPLVLFCVGKNTKAGQLIHQATDFSVNILQQNQRDLSTYFAGGWKEEAPPPFSFTPWHSTLRLDGSAAALGCSVHAIHEGGDHWIVVGRVIDVYRADDDVQPLVFFGGRYATIS
jgi:3-hydroxy-9,10-secoandrosta-1,3,5(10)-triene-9,17-dione monooxygenase reductase component